MRSACVALLVLATSMLAACGGGDSGEQGPPGSRSNPLVALPNPSSTRTPPTGEAGPRPQARPAARERLAEEGGRTQRGRRDPEIGQRPKSGSGARAARNPSASRGERKQKTLPASAKRPCSLVTRAQAQAIIGSPILEPLEAPQGPSCIYQTKAGRPYVTLAVQRVEFSELKTQLRDSRRVDVPGGTAYCGTYGRRMLYLPLSGGRVLSVAASCELASKFAARAAARL